MEADWTAVVRVQTLNLVNHGLRQEIFSCEIGSDKEKDTLHDENDKKGKLVND